MTTKVLITDKLADEGIDILQKAGYHVDVNLGLSEDELVSIIEPYHALIVRSQTKVTPRVIEAAKNMRIIGRAGVTVDNIDLEAATEHGIIVCNAPTSNIVTAAEYTMGLILACARNIPQANASMHEHKWDRQEFIGETLINKTLAIFGLGRVGGLVAERARAFGMNIVGHDPYCSQERAANLGVELLSSIEEVLERADVITLHLPRTVNTEGMFGRDEFAAMKNGVIFINTARGGICDMEAMADFIAAGKIRSVGVDIFEEEPCYDSPLHEFENAILTPRIGSFTYEAQILASKQIAEYVHLGLSGSIVPTAVNIATAPPEVIDTIGPFVPACRMMGRMVSQLLGGIAKHVEVELAGALSGSEPEVLVAGVLDGMLAYRRLGAFTPSQVNAVAQRHGMTLSTVQTPDAGEYGAAVRVKADGVEVASTLFGKDHKPRIISLLGYKIDIVPAKYGLVFEYVDAPGRIGTIGTILGNAGINITTMQIGTKEEESCALVYVNVADDVSEEVMDQLREAIDLKNLWKLSL